MTLIFGPPSPLLSAMAKVVDSHPAYLEVFIHMSNHAKFLQLVAKEYHLCRHPIDELEQTV